MADNKPSLENRYFITLKAQNSWIVKGTSKHKIPVFSSLSLYPETQNGTEVYASFTLNPPNQSAYAEKVKKSFKAGDVVRVWVNTDQEGPTTLIHGIILAFLNQGSHQFFIQ